MDTLLHNAIGKIYSCVHVKLLTTINVNKLKVCQSGINVTLRTLHIILNYQKIIYNI